MAVSGKTAPRRRGLLMHILLSPGSVIIGDGRTQTDYRRVQCGSFAEARTNAIHSAVYLFPSHHGVTRNRATIQEYRGRYPRILVERSGDCHSDRVAGDRGTRVGGRAVDEDIDCRRANAGAVHTIVDSGLDVGRRRAVQDSLTAAGPGGVVDQLTHHHGATELDNPKYHHEEQRNNDRELDDGGSRSPRTTHVPAAKLGRRVQE